MKMRSVLLSSLAIFSVALSDTTLADRDEDDVKVRSGVVRCGGNNFLRLNDTEVQFTAYNIRNFDATTAITIKRMRAFDATGTAIFDSSVTGLPVAPNGLLGPTDNVLGPNQSTQLFSYDFVPFLGQNNRPIQLEIEWTAPNRVVPLDAAITRVSRGRDAAGEQTEERGRSALACINIRAR